MSRTERRAVRTAERVYRAFLYAFPRPFRRRHGTDVIEAFRDGCRDAHACGGPAAVVIHLLRATVELLHQGVRERFTRSSLPTPRSPRRGTMLDRTINDLRYAARALRRAPAFTAVAIATLGLGIGANTAIFSVVNGVLLRPLPYEDPDELVVFTTRFKDRGGINLSEPEYVDLRTLTSSFEGVAAVDTQTVTLGGATEPERLQVGNLSAEALPLLGVAPALGRGFTAEDDAPGADRVVLLGHALWQQAFGGDSGVVGRTLELEGIAHEVVGVMPPDFAYPSEATRAWVPLRLDFDDLWERNNHYLPVIGRLKDGVSIEAARAELALLSAQLNAEYPDFYAEGSFGFEVVGMLERAVGDTRTPLLTLFGAVLFVLLVACVNVANLLLARAETRRREIAVRSALGGGRVAIARQLFAESLLLALGSALLGLLLAGAGVRLLLRVAPDAVPRAHNVGLDGGVLSFTLLVAVAVSLLFGLLPGVRASFAGVQGVLQDAGRAHSGSPRGRRSRAALVLLEVSLAAVLLVGGGVMMRSFANLRSVDPGFDYRRVLTAQLDLPETEFEEPQEVVDYYERVIEAVAALPGADSVGAIARLPLARGINNWSLQIEGQVVTDVANAPVAAIQQATPGYREAMGLELLRGRFFTPTDRAGAVGVAVVSKSFVDQYWPGEDPVGRRVKVFLEDWPWLEVIGVVGDVHQYGLAQSAEPTIYFAHAQAFETAYTSPANMHLVVRTSIDPAELVSALRETVWEINDSVPFGLVAPMREVLARSLAAERFLVVLLGIFAAVALFLSVVGIAGVITYSVSERTREIGIRVALGAERAQILRLVVAPALALTLVGVLAGIGVSTLFTGVFSDMLFEIEPIDPVTHVAVLAVFLAAALVACYLPARRAARLDPVVTLRDE